MRRSAQYRLQAGKDGALDLGHVEAALDEMLFSGGSLNKRLLGGDVDDTPFADGCPVASFRERLRLTERLHRPSCTA